MKCIYCNSDTKYKDRRSNGGRCQACKHPFAFEPYSDARKVTDTLFQRTIRDVSGNGQISFTERQLWYELCRRLSRRQWGRMTPAAGAVIALSGFGSIGAAILLSTGWPILAGVAGIGCAIAMCRRAQLNEPPRPRVTFDDFRGLYLRSWVGAHGPIERLLPDPDPRPVRRVKETEPDVTAYSFDRALVTNSAATAAMLVANNFHFENNCAILSLDGYPYEIAGTVMEMLRRNPQLKVFALHDATADGCALPRALRAGRWFPDPSVAIIDLGLRPRHAQSMKLITLPGSPQTLSNEARESLSAEEVAWLERGESVEVAAMRPARLMRAIYQGFARAGQVGTGAIADDGGVIWFYYSGADVYAADSFG